MLGLDFKTFRNTATYATPTWSEMTKIRDVTVDTSKRESESSTRASTWAEFEGALKEGGIEIVIKYDNTDTDFVALRDAFLNDTQLDIWAADGASATSGTAGLRMTCEVMSMSQPQELEGTSYVTFNVRPSPNSDSEPEWFETP